MSRWIDFALVPPPKKVRKTKRWLVWTKDGKHLLGTVRWWGPWRQYAFEVEEKTIFERECLRDIADFCDEQTKLHKAQWRNKPA